MVKESKLNIEKKKKLKRDELLVNSFTCQGSGYITSPILDFFFRRIKDKNDYCELSQ